METFDNIIDPARYDSTQQNAKAAYISTLQRQGQRICRGIVVGQAAVAAKRSLAVLQAVKLTLDVADTNYTSLGCPNNTCPSNLQAADYVKLGSYLKDRYAASYECGQSECVGLCMTSVQVTSMFLIPGY